MLIIVDCKEQVRPAFMVAELLTHVMDLVPNVVSN